MVRLDRYMLSQLLYLFGFFALVMVGIFWINRGVSLFDQLISNGHSALVFLELTVLGLPRLVTFVLPIAAFTATVYVTNRLINDSELTVMQATGRSPFRLAWPVVVFGVSLFFMASVLHHLLMPMAREQLEKREDEVARNATARLLTEGRFLHPSDGITFYTGSIGDDGVLRDVFLSDERRNRDSIIYTAAEAYLIQNADRTILIMIDGMAQRLDKTEDRLATANFLDFSFDISKLIAKGSRSNVSAKSLTTPELLKSWDTLPESTGRSVGYITRVYHERFAEPLFCVVAALIGFAMLMVAGYSRFGVWREAGFAFLLLVIVDGARSTLKSPLQKDPSLWPLLYLPTIASAAFAILLLWYAARPNGSFARLFRRRA